MPMELFGKSLEELRALAVSWGEPAWRGAQLYHSLYAERQLDFARMTALPAPLRQRLSAEAAATLPRIAGRYASSDGSVRYLLALAGPPAGEDSPDPVTVETVFMPSPGRQTICVSTQAGCAVGCLFCLTATLGLVRNLTAGEILGQVFVALAENAATLAPRTNVVFMGQGEPLLNYDQTIAATRILLDPNALGLAPRHVTISTSGIVPGIDRLAAEGVRPKLAISLNATTDHERARLMPLNRKYPLAQLLDACRRYPLRSWEQLTFEYVLLGGLNDRRDDARRVARLLAGLRAKVNLIPWNPGELPYRQPDSSAVEQFRRVLTEHGIHAFVRFSRGQDVFAACGQLALIDRGGVGRSPARSGPAEPLVTTGQPPL
ncbi:MAG TPA: 23S rRNA (adenine(2503)-C(2))-methyltransferase RlmN [Candidatus Dormibacteraeota bacterium]|nr:23S rRNA (adenine(2503)-C(2))-methyltransferase RlmN [Candidatus Dormibacteraeota bacterium]